MKSYHWKGIYYNSIENCAVNIAAHGIVIKSDIIGKHDNTSFNCEYRIETTTEWTTKSFEIRYTLNGISHTISALHETDWIVNGETRPEFRNCTDIDITLTPFTNSLPINRLKLQNSKPQQIEVLYIDVLKNTFRIAQQQYTKRSASVYNFQNVPNDFEADIIVDNDGFVKHYPELFERITV